MNKGYIIGVPWSGWLGPDFKEMGLGTKKINSFSLHLQRPKSSVFNNVTQNKGISNQELDSVTPIKTKHDFSFKFSGNNNNFWLDEPPFFLCESLQASLQTLNIQWKYLSNLFNSFLLLLLMILTLLCFVLGLLTSRVALCRHQVHEVWWLRGHCGYRPAISSHPQPQPEAHSIGIQSDITLNFSMAVPFTPATPYWGQALPRNTWRNDLSKRTPAPQTEPQIGDTY